jgi:hypothetical protein
MALQWDVLCTVLEEEKWLFGKATDGCVFDKVSIFCDES